MENGSWKTGGTFRTGKRVAPSGRWHLLGQGGAGRKAGGTFLGTFLAFLGGQKAGGTFWGTFWAAPSGRHRTQVAPHPPHLPEGTAKHLPDGREPFGPSRP